MNSFVVLLEWKNFVEIFNEIAIPNAVHKHFEERNILVVVVVALSSYQQTVWYHQAHCEWKITQFDALRAKTIYIFIRNRIE